MSAPSNARPSDESNALTVGKLLSSFAGAAVLSPIKTAGTLVLVSRLSQSARQIDCSPHQRPSPAQSRRHGSPHGAVWLLWLARGQGGGGTR